MRTSFDRIVRRLGLRRSVAWQLRHHPQRKFAVIEPILSRLGVGSVLDVGCNAGAVTRLAGAAGYFAVGIDQKVDLRGVQDPLEHACIGNCALTPELIEKIPRFDAVLLLSVHHQWVRLLGDEQARAMVAGIADRAEKVFVIEFAAVARKYTSGGSVPFVENDEASVTAYAREWLGGTLPGWSAEYAGPVPQAPDEPFRFVFACRRQPG